MFQKKPFLKKISDWFIDNRYFFFFFGPLALIYLLWWLAFYPGNLSPDSITQWQEATTGHFTNASPFFYAFLLSLLIKILYSPAIMGLFQLLTLAIIVAAFLSYGLKRGLDKKISYPVIFLYLVLPQFGIYNVTIWKDVLYANVLLGLLFYTFILFKEPGLLERKKHLIFFPIVIALVPLMRFNGLFVIPLVPFLFFFFKRATFKKAGYLFLMVCFIFGLIYYGLGGALRVKKAPLLKEGLAVKAVGAIYNLENPDLTIEEREIFNRIIPEDRWRKSYSCLSVDELFYNELTMPKGLSIFDERIDRDIAVANKWHKAVIMASLRNPEALVIDKVCLSSYLFGVKGSLYKYELGIWKPEGSRMIWAESKLPKIQRYLTRYLTITSGESPNLVSWSANPTGYIISQIFWSGWIPTLAFLTALILSFRKKYWGTFAYSTITLLNLLTTAVLVPAASFRYIYALYVATPLLIVVYFLEISKKKSF